MDSIVRATANRMPDDDTLIVFTADHSFELLVTGGRKGEPLLGGAAIQVGRSHTAEEVVVAAEGPGSERVHRLTGCHRPRDHLWRSGSVNVRGRG